MADQIPTNRRTTVRVKTADGIDVQPWTIEFKPSDPDLVRLYSVDGDPKLILVETSDAEGAFTLTCILGQHGEPHEPAGALEIEITRDAPEPGEVEFDLR